MRIIKERTVYTICLIDKYKSASENLEVWLTVIREANWARPADLKAKFRNASIIDSKRVVFNIKGNEFRLVADIEYRLKTVFIIWFGTHKEYEKTNIKKLTYGHQDY
jgi:mRNA interferase HigB